MALGSSRSKYISVLARVQINGGEKMVSAINHAPTGAVMQNKAGDVVRIHIGVHARHSQPAHRVEEELVKLPADAASLIVRMHADVLYAGDVCAGVLPGSRSVVGYYKWKLWKRLAGNG